MCRSDGHPHGASDYAVSDGKCATSPCTRIRHRSERTTLYVLRLVRRQTSSEAGVENLLALARHWSRPRGRRVSQIEKGVVPSSINACARHSTISSARQFASSADKPILARAIQARMTQGKVKFPRNRSWTPGLIEELLRFPRGHHNDVRGSAQPHRPDLPQLAERAASRPPESARHTSRMDELLAEA